MPATRVRRRHSATTCPYCHDTCSEHDEVSVCRGCLARHHRDCWWEGRGCASCRSDKALVDAVQPPPVRPRAERGRALRPVGWLLTIVAWLTLLATHIVFAPGVSMYDMRGISLNYVAYQAQKGNRTRGAVLALTLGLTLIGVARIREIKDPARLGR